MKENRFSWLSCSRRESAGLLLLFSILLVVYFLPKLWFLIFPRPVYDFAPFAQEVARFQRQQVLPSAPETGSPPAMRLFHFDPNILDSVGWLSLGLSARQAGVLIRYRNRGGRFRKAEDLARIYSISQQQVQQLTPFVRINGESTPHSRFAGKDYQQKLQQKSKALQLLDINAADSAQLDQLRGIGPAFASRIIRYRERLGGFVSAGQLMEVYGMDSLRHATLIRQVVIDPSKIRTIPINTASFEVLKHNPYLRFTQINAILRYRQQHGKFSNTADLSKVLILNDEIIRKIEPYLVFDP